jgi:hypothetical protein
MTTTLFWLRIPFLIVFLALIAWLLFTVYKRGGGRTWL